MPGQVALAILGSSPGQQTGWALAMMILFVTLLILLDRNDDGRL